MTKKRVFILTVFIFLIGISIGLFCGNQIAKRNNSFDEPSESINQAFYELNYYSGGYEKDQKFIEWLNNNSIDKKYSEELYSNLTPTEGAIAIGNWIEAYDKELDAVFTEIEKVIESAKEYNEDEADIKNAIDSYNKMKSEYEKYLNLYSGFVFNLKTATVGHGSGIPADAGYYVLNMERTMLFDFATLLYDLTGTYTFVTESATYYR